MAVRFFYVAVGVWMFNAVEGGDPDENADQLGRK